MKNLVALKKRWLLPALLTKSRKAGLSQLYFDNYKSFDMGIVG